MAQRDHSPQEPDIPASVDAELALIGCVAIDGRMAFSLSWVKPDWFTHGEYRIIWQAILALVHEGETPDAITVSDKITTMGLDEENTHLRWLQSGNQVLSSYQAPHYAEIIHRHYLARECILLGNQLVQLGFKQEPEAAIRYALQKLARLHVAGSANTYQRQSYDDLLTALVDDTEKRMQGEVCGVRFGFGAIDAWLGGIDPGSLVLLVGRPGSGKSAMGLSIARRMAGRMQHLGQGCVDVVTMEMHPLAQTRRLLAARSGIDSRMMRSGFRTGNAIDERAWSQFLQSYGDESRDAGNALFFTGGSMTTDAIFAHALQAQAENDMQVLVIDQLDLCADEAKEGETVRIGRISMALKQLAMKLGIVVICLAQLNREVEKRADHRPQLADLRQSGRLEQDADVVIALYRPDYYYPYEAGDPDWYPHYAEMLGLKNRDGVAKIGIPVRFCPESASFTDWYEEIVGDIAEVLDRKERGK